MGIYIRQKKKNMLLSRKYKLITHRISFPKIVLAEKYGIFSKNKTLLISRYAKLLLNLWLYFLYRTVCYTLLTIYEP